MLKIFKDHSSRTCILDDFGFYEGRQNTIQEKKAKQQQYQKQMWEGKQTDERNKEEGANGELKSQKSSEVASDLVKETVPDIQTNGDVNLSENLSMDKSAGCKGCQISYGGEDCAEWGCKWLLAYVA